MNEREANSFMFEWKILNLMTETEHDMDGYKTPQETLQIDGISFRSQF